MLGFDVFDDTFLGISPGQSSTAYAIVSRAEGDDPVADDGGQSDAVGSSVS